MKMLRLPALAAAATLLVAAPAFSQAPISQGRTSATTQLQASNADLRIKLVDLETENARLTGEVEELRFLLNQSREQIEGMQADDQEIARQLKLLNSKINQLSNKVSELESGGSSSRFTSGSTAPSASGSTGTTTTIRRTVTTDASGPKNISGTSTNRTPVPTEAGAAEAAGAGVVPSPITVSSDTPPQTGSLGTISASNLPGAAGPLFAEAKLRLTQFDHAGAEEAFRAFLEQFADDPQAGEAQYWLGETLYQQGAYAEAGAAYTLMIQKYPDDLRAPDALVKLARAMRLVGESERACAALSALPQRYPDASAVTKNLAAVEATRASCG